MPNFLLRIEAVNLGNLIDDTDDLSTRRGGGLMALNAIPQILDDSTLVKEAREQLKPIAAGASIGLYSFEAKSSEEAKTLTAIVQDHFQKHGTLEYQNRDDANKTEHLELKHGTFAIDFTELGESDYGAWQTSIAKNRWRQMKESSVSLVDLWNPSALPCTYDMIRPGSLESYSKDGAPIAVSPSVKARREYGRQAKQNFYESEWTRGQQQDPYPGHFFTNEFSQIASHPDGSKCPLHNKLSVFYVDGNKFGEFGRKTFESGLTQYQAWSSALRNHHSELLRDLLRIAGVDSLWKNNDLLRLETLLWGGDEIIWVVPAWKGWELAKWFFEQDHTVNGQRVTYSAGLVFCHTKAPIKNIVKLAKRLGDKAKECVKDPTTDHRLAYEVMESFDDIPGDLDEHRERWLPSFYRSSALVIDPKRIQLEVLHRIASEDKLPMRQLFSYCKAWRTGIDLSKSKKEQDKQAKTLGEVVSSSKRWLERECKIQLDQLIHSDVDYLHLLQMLPYFPSQKEESK